MNNTTGNFSISIREMIMDLFEDAIISVLFFQVLFTIIGTTLNVWFLYTILKNPELRSNIRNLGICSILFSHLFILIRMPLVTTLGVSILQWNLDLDCSVHTAYSVMDCLMDFIFDWTLTVLIIIHLCQNMEVDLASKLHPTVASIGKYVLLLLPWIVGIIIVPTIMKSLADFFINDQPHCFTTSPMALFTFEMVNCAAPNLISACVLIAAEVYRRRRLAVGFYSSSEAGLTESLVYRNVEADKTKAFLVALVCTVLLDITLSLAIYGLGSEFGIDLWATGEIISEARVIVMPLPWLLLKDIRTEILFWRKQPTTGQEGDQYTVSYTRQS